MVRFPANSPGFGSAEGPSDAVRLDAILPDVLRRYGLELERNDARPDARNLPEDRRRQPDVRLIRAKRIG